MNLTNEQIDAAIAALTELKAKREPRVMWMVLDRDGDRAVRTSTNEALVRSELFAKRASGHFGPYTLYRCVEVIE